MVSYALAILEKIISELIICWLFETVLAQVLQVLQVC